MQTVASSNELKAKTPMWGKFGHHMKTMFLCFITMCKKPTIAGDDTKLIFTQQTLFGRFYIVFRRFYIGFGCLCILYGIFATFAELKSYKSIHTHIFYCLTCVYVCMYVSDRIFRGVTGVKSFAEVSGCSQNVVQIAIVPQYQGSNLSGTYNCCLEEIVLICCYYPQPGKFWGKGGCCCCFNTCGANCCLVNTIYVTTENSNQIVKSLKKRQSDGIELVVVGATENSKETNFIQ
eukprot:47372_1